MNRRNFLQVLGAATAGLSTHAFAHQVVPNTYPIKELRLIVPFPAGGAADNLGRPLARGLSQAYGQPVVVENRPGANSMIGIRATAESAADGYTLLLANEAGLSIAPALTPITGVEVPYNPRDFATVSVLGQYGSVLSVSKKLPVRNLAEFIDYAKKNPRKVSYASFGVGSQPQMMMETLAKEQGLELIHVPYKGVAPAVIDLVAGHVDAMISAPSAPTPFINEGKLNALAYSGNSRLESLPDVPTFAEGGLPEFEARGWFGLVVHRNTPEDIKASLRKTVWSIVQSPEYQSVAIGPSGYEVPSIDPSEFPAFLDQDMQRWKLLVNQISNRLS